MKRYIFNIKQNFNGNIDDQNVWVVANSRQATENEVRSEYHNIVDTVLVKVSDYDF